MELALEHSTAQCTTLRVGDVLAVEFENADDTEEKEEVEFCLSLGEIVRVEGGVGKGVGAGEGITLSL